MAVILALVAVGVLSGTAEAATTPWVGTTAVSCSSRWVTVPTTIKYFNGIPLTTSSYGYIQNEVSVYGPVGIRGYGVQYETVYTSIALQQWDYTHGAWQTTTGWTSWKPALANRNGISPMTGYGSTSFNVFPGTYRAIVTAYWPSTRASTVVASSGACIANR